MARADLLFDDQASWRYLKGLTEASAPDPTAWRERDFDDSAWPVGNAPFFYETGSGYTGNTDLADMPGAYACVFLRKTFRIDGASTPELGLDVRADDGCVVWINGAEVLRVNVPDGEIPFNGTSLGALGEPNVAGIQLTNTASFLVTGTNVIAIQALNSSLSSSSDFLITATLSATADVVAPQVAATVPEPNARIAQLEQIEVIFSESVQGVNAGDLLVNGTPAAGLTPYSPRDYLFTFPEPATGTVQVAWTAGHGIADLAVPPNPFGGGAWQYTLDPTAPAGVVRLTEFLAFNEHGIRDEDGDRADWIELFNPGSTPVSLAGWSLTDDPDDLTQWQFPDVSLAARSYRLVWASGKNRTDPNAPLHTNFRLSDTGEYLALVDAQNYVVSEFAPAFPPQQPDISYGLDAADPKLRGYFPTPTPGAPNLPGGPGFAPTPVFSLPGAVYGNTTLTVTVSAPSGTIRYTTDGSTPTESSPAYSGPLQLTASQVVQARVFEPGLLPSPIVIQHYVLAGTSVRNFSSNLPLLVINTSRRAIPQDSRIPAAVIAIDPWRGRTRVDGSASWQGKAQIEVRGQSSAGFPKQAYNLELNDAYGNDLEVPLLGLPAESDWALHNPYSDKSLLNNFLAYELHEKMGHYAVRRRFVELFVDTSGGRLEYPQDYAGIYVLIEKIKVDNQRVDLARLTPEQNDEPQISGGYIIKKDKSSPGDRVFYTQGGAGFGGQEFRIHEPKPDEITGAQLNWIRNYLNAFERALFASSWLTATGTNHYSYYIDVDSFVDNHWIVEFTKQIDGYRLSNYLSKDRAGRLRMEPIWDWNLSFGNANYLTGESTAGWYWTQTAPNDHLYLRRLITGSTLPSGTGDPDFVQRLIDRWGELRNNVLAGSNVVARIDEIAVLLDEAQVREFQKWPRLGSYVWPNPQFYVTPTTYAGIIAAQKSWVLNRFAWIDRLYPLPPELSVPAAYVTPGFELSISGNAPELYYTTNGFDPRLPGGNISPSASSYSGPITVQHDVKVVARSRRSSTWGGPAAASYFTQVSPLRITEIMFRPAPPPAGDTNAPEAGEFIELANLGPSPLDLAGYALVDGVRFSFATGQVAVLQPGARVIVLRDAGAFAARYGDQIPVAGAYEGALDNNGERLTLAGPLGEWVQSFQYDPDRFPATDGLGFSLVPAQTGDALTDWDEPIAWRPSAAPGGSPGQPDEQPAPVPAVWVNEVLTHTDLPDVDFIELYNPTDAEVDVGGWYLSDDPRTPKFCIPDSTRLAPGGYVCFTEADFHIDPEDPASFNLRSSGDEVYLFSANAAGELTGARHGFAFGAALNGVAFGRHVNSEGRERLVPVQEPTPSAANAAPSVGPVVISEIMYHPPDVVTNGAAWNNTEDEFIELHNLEPAPVPLFDPNAPTNAWQLRDAVRYTFPTNQSLAQDERILVVSFDPLADPTAAAAFRARYALSPAIRLFGPFTGQLDNSGESVELIRPDLVRFYVTNQVVTAVRLDQVRYRDRAPWPAGADGFGLALQRVDESAFGDEPTNWVAAAPTPGAAYRPGNRPIITSSPSSQRVAAGSRVTFTVQASGAGPLQCQWRKDETHLPGATQATFVIASAQPSDAGRYDVVVWSNLESATSEPAVLTVEVPPAIQKQPESVTTQAGVPIQFSVVASSPSPMQFEWRVNGLPIAGANQPSLQFSGSPAPLPGAYDVVIRSRTGSVTSAPALLVIEGDSLIAQPPVAASAPEGGTATFSVQLTNSAVPPFSYTWLKDGLPLTTHVTSTWTDFLPLTDLQPSDAGLYSVVVTNASNPGETSPTAALTVLPDTDHDGIPDATETLWDLNPTDPTDAAQDPDGDGASNVEEYRAGTDPDDGLSVLRLSVITEPSGVRLRFVAAADRTYSLLACDAIDNPAWRCVAAFPATSASSGIAREIEVTDPEAASPGERYYWVVCPAVAE